MDFLDITKRYYAEWLDCDAHDFSSSLKYICTLKRDEKPSFYPNPYPLFICRTEKSVIVSYSPSIQKYINMMEIDEPVLNRDSSQLVSYLEKLFEAKIIHNIKFVFDKAAEYPADNVVSLKKDEYHLFLKFAEDLGSHEWEGMREYFEELCTLGYCFAKMVDGKAVCLVDAPGMPYMRESVQEIGINTLPEYRNRGYGKEVASCCLRKIVADGKCPLWSCRFDNIGSERLAYSIGFKKFCDAFLLVL
jgi:hypothetical protein